MPTTCGRCGIDLPDQEKANPCPACGSTIRRISENVVEKIVAGTDMHTKVYIAGKSRKKGVRFETKDGDSLSTDRGRFMKRHQLVDKENKWYKKTVVDPETGEVLRDIDEPLPDHKGRGSAKNQNDS